MLTKERIPVATYPSSYDMFEERSRPGPRVFRRHLTSALHTTSLVASLIATSLFAAAIPRWDSNFFHNSGPNRGDWTDGMPLGPLVFALIYHAATLVYNHTTRRQRGPTPDAVTTPSNKPLLLILHALSSSLILATLFASLILAAYGSLFRFWRPATRTQSGGVPCNTMLNVFASECQPVLYSVGRLQLAGIVFGSAVWLCHFALFLIALRNLKRRSMIKRVQSEKLAQFSLPRSSSSSSSEDRTLTPGRTRSTRAMSLGRSLSMRAQQKSNHGSRRGERAATRPGPGSGSGATVVNNDNNSNWNRRGPGQAQGWYDAAGGGGGGGENIQRPTQTLPPVSSRYS